MINHHCPESEPIANDALRMSPKQAATRSSYFHPSVPSPPAITMDHRLPAHQPWRKCCMPTMGAALLLSVLSLCLPLPADGFGSRNALSRSARAWTAALRVAVNPNDQETPEERQARMKLVRKIQSSFYQEEAAFAEKGTSTSKWLQRDPENPAIIDGLPLWRVQRTELPGRQNLLNVDEPHYTHMFRRLVLQHPKPWLFGQLYLPDGSENTENPDFLLPDDEESPRQSQATLVGTLMQVTDYATQDDGRLTLIVQGVGRIKVLAAGQQVPYAVARVRTLPDQESWGQYLYPAVGAAGAGVELSMALIDASRAVAAREGELFRDVEYHQTLFNPEDIAPEEVSPLSNINGSVAFDLGRIREEAEGAFSAGLSRKAEELGSDEILLASSTLKLDHVAALGIYYEKVASLEQMVWIQFDRMMRLLRGARPEMNFSVPEQMLGLMPTNFRWPSGFQLDTHAERLEANQAHVGTYSKSPFVRLSRKYPEYPAMRRASRLSYAIWILLPSIVVDSLLSQQLLETSSIVERLQMAVDELMKVNKAIESSFKQ